MEEMVMLINFREVSEWKLGRRRRTAISRFWILNHSDVLTIQSVKIKKENF